MRLHKPFIYDYNDSFSFKIYNNDSFKMYRRNERIQILCCFKCVKYFFYILDVTIIDKLKLSKNHGELS